MQQQRQREKRRETIKNNTVVCSHIMILAEQFRWNRNDHQTEAKHGETKCQPVKSSQKPRSTWLQCNRFSNGSLSIPNARYLKRIHAGHYSQQISKVSISRKFQFFRCVRWVYATAGPMDALSHRRWTLLCKAYHNKTLANNRPSSNSRNEMLYLLVEWLAEWDCGRLSDARPQRNGA